MLVLLVLAALPVTAAAAAAPTIGYLTPDPIRSEEATLRFTIDPEGLETSYEVMYGEAAGSYHPFHEPLDGVLPAGDDPVLLEKTIPVFFEGPLTPGTEYHWRVVATNAAGTTEGADQSFTTPVGPAPVLVNGGATQTGPASVSFTGTVDPEGALLTGCRFRYLDKVTFTQAGFEKPAAGEIVRFGETVPCTESFAEIGSGTEPVTVHGEATGLAPGEYVFRLEAENEFKDATAFGGVPFTVTAPALPPANPPSGVTPPGLSTAPGLATAPGLSTAPGLQKPRRKKVRRANRLRHNATIVAPRSRR